MNFEQYIALIKKFKDILKNYPENGESFQMHYALVTTRIKSFELFRFALNEHLKISDWFPTHLDLFKAILPKLDPIDASKILDKKDPYHCRIREILEERYMLSIPKCGSWDFRNADTHTVGVWLNSIAKNLLRFSEDFSNLKVRYEDIYTEEVQEWFKKCGELAKQNEQIKKGEA